MQQNNRVIGYQTRINAVLEPYVRAQKQKDYDQHRDH